jgi:hypothetical protein
MRVKAHFARTAAIISGPLSGRNTRGTDPSFRYDSVQFGDERLGVIRRSNRQGEWHDNT